MLSLNTNSSHHKGPFKKLRWKTKWNSYTHSLASFKIKNLVNQRCVKQKQKAGQNIYWVLFFCGERQKIDGNVVEEVQRPKTTSDLPKSLIPNSKNQVFIQHDHFQVFLNFFSGKRAGFIQTLLKTTVKIPPNIQCRHS